MLGKWAQICVGPILVWLTEINDTTALKIAMGDKKMHVDNFMGGQYYSIASFPVGKQDFIKFRYALS